MSQHEKRTTKVHGDEGFTLIELMVVISILGILAGLAIPRLQVYRAEAKKIEAVAFGRQVLNTLTVHAANDLRGEYPVIETYEELETVLAEAGSPLTQRQKESLLPDGSASIDEPFMLCICGWLTIFDCFEIPPPACDDEEIEPIYIFSGLTEFDYSLMVSTDGTTRVLDEDEMSAFGFFE